ncbi:hypothetical protein MMC13_006198 [Lambiella insularis]|nr:hypothetical protein [Lambiella insularis]
MPTFRCIKHEWQLPSIGRDDLIKTDPAQFARQFFAIPANKRIQRSEKDDRMLLTAGFVACINKELATGALPRGWARQDLVARFTSDRYWDRGSSTGGLHEHTWKADVRAPDIRAPDIRAPVEHRQPCYIPSVESSSSPKDYVAPPRSSLRLEEFTLKAFYDRFCYTNPEALYEHYGKDLYHIQAAYRNTTLPVPENIIRKHCDDLALEIEQLKTAGRTYDNGEQTKELFASKRPSEHNGEQTKELFVLKRPMVHNGERVEAPMKRIKIEEPNCSPNETNTTSSAFSRGTQVEPLPLPAPSLEGLAEIPVTVAAPLYSPSMPHLQVDWDSGELQDTSAGVSGASVLPNHASEMSAGDGPPLVIIPTNPESDETVAQSAICNPIEREPSASSQPPLKGRRSLATQVARLQAFLEGASAEAERNDAPITTRSIRVEALLRGAATEVKALKMSMEDGAKTVAHKSVAKHVVRLETFLQAAATDVEDNDAPISPQSIRLEALLSGAAAELAAMKAAMGP